MQDLDRILDAALKSYVDQAAPPGLERRVLRRIHQPKRWLVWLPAAAILAAACLLLMPTQKTAPPVTVTPPHVEVAQAVSRTPPLPERPRKHRRVISKPEPTQQQLALADFARKYPEQAVAMVTHGEVVPLEIEPLEIPELKIEVITTQESTQ
jgi:hypothetical protein